jgi:hypothetical protein
VEELTKDKAELKRSNDLMRTQLDLLEQQNRNLMMNQLSAQPSSHMNVGSFMQGSTLAAPNNMSPLHHNFGNISGGGLGGNHSFNRSHTGFAASSANMSGPGGFVVEGNIAQDASAAFIGGGGGASMNGNLGSMALLDRLRFQQQLQLQQQQQQMQQQQQLQQLQLQQQQLGSMLSPPDGSRNETSTNQDSVQNNLRNGKNGNNNYLG